jgi:hypothetical protein
VFLAVKDLNNWRKHATVWLTMCNTRILLRGCRYHGDPETFDSALANAAAILRCISDWLEQAAIR